MFLEAAPDITCCFSGHRPAKLPWRYDEDDPRCVALKEKLFDIADALYCAGIRHYICGMAPGCDMYFCEAVMRLRDMREDVTIEAAIPCEGQSNSWDEGLKRRYRRLVAACDKSTLLQSEYTRDCMLKRNMYMVEHSSVLVTVYGEAIGGTMHTINYAKKLGLEIIEVHP